MSDFFSLIKRNWLEFVAIIIVFVDLFIDVVPVLPFAVLIFAVIFIRLSLIDTIVVTILVLPSFLGTLLNVNGISGVGGYLYIWAILLLMYGFIKKKIVMKNWLEHILPLFCIFALMTASVYTTTGGDYAPQKLLRTLFIGTLSFIAFETLFCNILKSDCVRLGLYFILFGLFFLRISSIVNQQPGPSGIFDFGYMRINDYYSLNDDFRISYHVPGLVALRGVGFMMLVSIYKRINQFFLFLCILLCCLISLYAGGRQFIISAFVLIAIWIYYEMKKSSAKTFILSLIISIVVGLFIFNMFSSEGMMGNISSEGYLVASQRDIPLLRGVELFLQNPLWGVGYGRYNLEGMYHYYPHNIIVEILCEMGIVGLIIILVLCIPPIRKTKPYIKIYIYLLAVLFFRAMASESLEMNIMLLSLIFALPSLINKKYLIA